MTTDTVDASFEAFKALLPQLEDDLRSVNSEEDVRLKIIDPIFMNVLGWASSAISTEEQTNDGFLDYKFSIDDRARLIVEAKKEARPLNLANRHRRNYKLSGSVLSKSPLPKDGILQAIRYCGDKNTELACVTNGREWIIFRGSRLGDGTDTLDGQAFVFADLESVKKEFTLFYDLLSYEGVESYRFRAYIQEAEGRPIRVNPFSKTLVPIGNHFLLPSNKLSTDLFGVMSAFFRRLSGDDDEEMLAKCFVTTRESQIADDSLVRITEDLANRVKSLDTATGEALTKAISHARASGKNEFILLVGTKGAGKSTFIDRFFKFVLPSELRNDCIVVRIDVGKSSGNAEDVANWLGERLLTRLEESLFTDGRPSFEELQGMFYDEYSRWMKGPYKHLYEENKIAFKNKFGDHVENIRDERREAYINRVLGHVVRVRKKVPCLIFDNTDHFSIEFQERVFQYARAIYESEMCLVITPITDKTSWQLSQQGALQSFESQSFFLPTPLPKVVMERRISFLGEKLQTERHNKGTGYFVGKGIHLELDDIESFAYALQKALLDTGNAPQWLGQLANQDIRRCLELASEVMCSPYIPVEQMIKAVVAGRSYTLHEGNLKRAAIRRGYDVYPSGNHPYVQNVFALNTEIDSTPLLALRILRLLRDSKHHAASGLETYLTLDQVVDYTQAIGIDRTATLLTLEVLLNTGLCLNYDPTVRDVSAAQRIQISPSGEQHLAWGCWDETYIGSMLKVTPIHDENVFNDLRNCKQIDGKSTRWKKELSIFIKYLLDEDQVFTISTGHAAYEGQEVLTKSLRRRLNRISKSLG